MTEDATPFDEPRQKPISRRLRFEILRRDNSTCRYCGAVAGPDVPMTVDHVVPRALGGGDDPANLVAACRDCNLGKASVSPDSNLVADVAEDAARFAAALERVAEQRRAQVRENAAALHTFDAIWCNWTWTDRDGSKHNIDRDSDWQGSVERFVLGGLNSEDFTHLVHATMTTPGVRDEWRYFCHKAWSEIRRRQDIARSSLSDPEDVVNPEDFGSPDYMRGYHDGWEDSNLYRQSGEV